MDNSKSLFWLGNNEIEIVVCMVDPSMDGGGTKMNCIISTNWALGMMANRRPQLSIIILAGPKIY